MSTSRKPLGREVTVLLAMVFWGCGSGLCDGISQSCLDVRVQTSAATDPSLKSDRLRILISRDSNPIVEKESTPVSGNASSFPLAFTVLLGETGGTVALDVIAELATMPILRGQGSQEVAPGAHQKITITLSAEGGSFLLFPSARTGAGLAYFPERRSVVMFGGKNVEGQVLSDTWEYLPARKIWRQLLPTSSPDARTTTLVYHPKRKALLLFGGVGGDGQALADTWILDSAGIWSPLFLSSAPPPRDGAALAYDSLRDALQLYGGQASHVAQPFSDSWELPAAGSAWQQREFAAPIPTIQTPHLIFSGSDLLLIGSNETGQTPISVFRAEATSGGPPMFTWRELLPQMAPPVLQPSRRTGYAAALDKRTGMIVLFGGLDAGMTTGETYFWNPMDANWRLADTAGPSARSGAMADFVPELNGIFLVGGQSQGAALLDERWLLVGNNWQKQP